MTPTLEALEPELFERFCEIAYQRAGIQLKQGKEPLVAARIARRMRSLGIGSPRDYLAHLEADTTEDELVHFLDAISTNFTAFMREPEHFELLAALVAEWRAQGRRRLRAWSAASSTGEEPYSIAMVALDSWQGEPPDFLLLATDLSTRVLAEARAGRYPRERLEALGPGRLRRHLSAVPGAPELLEVSARVRQRIRFRRLNLATPPYPMRGPLDLIFCRNVMIYFDRSVRQRLVEELERLLAPHGVLVTGHSETLTGLRSPLVAATPSVYCRPDALGWVRSLCPRGHLCVGHGSATRSAS
jgi:chemotaxis protein methyltransferase CheR